MSRSQIATCGSNGSLWGGPKTLWDLDVRWTAMPLQRAAFAAPGEPDAQINIIEIAGFDE